jgi:hypothetical protein
MEVKSDGTRYARRDWAVVVMLLPLLPTAKRRNQESIGAGAFASPAKRGKLPGGLKGDAFTNVEKSAATR